MKKRRLYTNNGVNDYLMKIIYKKILFFIIVANNVILSQTNIDTTSVKPCKYDLNELITYIHSQEDTNFIGFVEYVLPSPVLVGGLEQLLSKIVYPEKAKLNKVQGRVFVSCIVLKDSSFCEVKIERGIGYGCDEEAIRVVKEAKWIPVRLKDKDGNYKYFDSKAIVPVTFRLDKN